MKISKMEVTLVDHCGSDLSVVNAARVSMHKESEWEYLDPEYKSDAPWCRVLKDKDVKLINYLAKHNHWTPFAHAFLSFRIKVPIFVAMQLDKHTVGLVTNSVSRRYVDEEPEFYFPSLRLRADNIKQGSKEDTYTRKSESDQDLGEWAYSQMYEQLNLYNEMIKNDIAPEVARVFLPQNMMMERIWSGSLAAFSRVVHLRSDPHSQLEIQELAGAIAGLVEPLFPVSWSALMEN